MEVDTYQNSAETMRVRIPVMIINLLGHVSIRPISPDVQNCYVIGEWKSRGDQRHGGMAWYARMGTTYVCFPAKRKTEGAMRARKLRCDPGEGCDGDLPLPWHELVRLDINRK